MTGHRPAGIDLFARGRSSTERLLEGFVAGRKSWEVPTFAGAFYVTAVKPGGHRTIAGPYASRGRAWDIADAARYYRFTDIGVVRVKRVH